MVEDSIKSNAPATLSAGDIEQIALRDRKHYLGCVGLAGIAALILLTWTGTILAVQIWGSELSAGFDPITGKPVVMNRPHILWWQFAVPSLLLIGAALIASWLIGRPFGLTSGYESPEGHSQLMDVVKTYGGGLIVSRILKATVDHLSSAMYGKTLLLSMSDHTRCFQLTDRIFPTTRSDLRAENPPKFRSLLAHERYHQILHESWLALLFRSFVFICAFLGGIGLSMEVVSQVSSVWGVVLAPAGIAFAALAAFTLHRMAANLEVLNELRADHYAFAVSGVVEPIEDANRRNPVLGRAYPYRAEHRRYLATGSTWRGHVALATLLAFAVLGVAFHATLQLTFSGTVPAVVVVVLQIAALYFAWCCGSAVPATPPDNRIRFIGTLFLALLPLFAFALLAPASGFLHWDAVWSLLLGLVTFGPSLAEGLGRRDQSLNFPLTKLADKDSATETATMFRRVARRLHEFGRYGSFTLAVSLLFVMFLRYIDPRVSGATFDLSMVFFVLLVVLLGASWYASTSKLALAAETVALLIFSAFTAVATAFVAVMIQKLNTGQTDADLFLRLGDDLIRRMPQLVDQIRNDPDSLTYIATLALSSFILLAAFILVLNVSRLFWIVGEQKRQILERGKHEKT